METLPPPPSNVERGLSNLPLLSAGTHESALIFKTTYQPPGGPSPLLLAPLYLGHADLSSQRQSALWEGRSHRRRLLLPPVHPPPVRGGAAANADPRDPAHEPRQRGSPAQVSRGGQPVGVRLYGPSASGKSTQGGGGGWGL